MLTIIQSSTIKKALAVSPAMRGSSCLILDDLQEHFIASQKSSGVNTVDIAELNQEEIAAFEKEYLNTVARLSSAHHSVEWWANALSEKNEHVSEHYRNCSLFFRFVKTIERYTGAEMRLIVICRGPLRLQISEYCRQKGIPFSSLDNGLATETVNLSRKLYLFVARIYVLVAIVLRKVLLSSALGYRIRKIISANSYYVIRTWVDDRFSENSNSRFLPFFGNLPEHAIRKGYKLLILAGIMGNYRELIWKIRNFKSYPVLPEEYFVGYADLFRVIHSLFVQRPRLREMVLFNGLDMTVLYEEELNKGFLNPEYLKNILRYFMARRFAERVNFSHYIQTFENYAWEKMMLLGIQHAGKGGITLGFQHAFISRNSFKYFPGEAEQELTPLPDRIITRGEITRDIMIKYGHYNPVIVKTGCALRQEYLRDAAPTVHRKQNKIMVPFTMVARESGLILNFLIESGLPASGVTVVIRCHPMSPFSTFRKLVRHPIPDNFIISNEKTVQEEMSTTDLVIYTWTTVAFEAVKMGIPVIYLDILRPMYVDPLFECTSFKRTARVPADLLDRVQELYSLPHEQFNRELEAARMYIQRDFFPVTEENLEPFFTHHHDHAVRPCDHITVNGKH